MSVAPQANPGYDLSVSYFRIANVVNDHYLDQSNDESPDDDSEERR